MSQHLKKIDERIREIDETVGRLNSERVALLNLRAKFWQEQVLLPGEQITAKNSKKFELLAKIQKHLLTRRDSQGKISGASTRALYTWLTETYHEQINYGTFRSYLSRFKREGRLLYDQRSEKWFVTDHQREMI